MSTVRFERGNTLVVRVSVRDYAQAMSLLCNNNPAEALSLVRRQREAIVSMIATIATKPGKSEEVLDFISAVEGELESAATEFGNTAPVEWVDGR